MRTALTRVLTVEDTKSRSYLAAGPQRIAALVDGAVSTMARTRAAVLLAVLLSLVSACGGETMGPDDDGHPPDPDGGTPTEQCPGVAIVADGVRDIDVAAIGLSGIITLDGGPIPTASGGTIVFRKVGTASELGVQIHAGVSSYAVTLSPGVYDLLFRPDASECDRPANTGMPCVSGAIRTEVSLTADGVLDIDIPVARLSGTVTLCNADGSGCRALPDETMNRGALRFVNQGGTARSAPFAATGDVSYDIGLLPGSYRIELEANPLLCGSNTPSEVPCIDAPIGEVTASTSGVYDVGIPALQLSGGVRLCAGDGSSCARLPDETSGRGALVFNLEGGGSVNTPPFGATGPVGYALALVPGSYTVDLQANGGLCSGTTLPVMSCGGGRVLGPVTISADGVLDVDLPVVTVTGQARLCDAAGASCARMPDEASDRGALHFERSHGGYATTAPFAGSGAATYALRLLAGDYTVHFAANDGLCDGRTAPSVPCVGGPLQTGVSLHTDGVLDVAIPAVQISGRATLCAAGGSNCVGLPDESDSRGGLAFALAQGGTFSLPLGATGSADYALTLLPGSYEISYASSDTYCEEGSLMPCLDGVLVTTSILASGVLDVAIPMVTVGGLVTLEGSALPDSAHERGEVTFALRGGGMAQYALGSAGPELYSVRVIPGNYVIAQRANDNLCDGSNAPPMPCTDAVIAGCEP